MFIRASASCAELTSPLNTYAFTGSGWGVTVGAPVVVPCPGAVNEGIVAVAGLAVTAPPPPPPGSAELISLIAAADEAANAASCAAANIALGATEEQKFQIIEFYNKRIEESNAKTAKEKEKADKDASDASIAIAEQEAAAKEAALNSSVDAIQSALTDLFGESKAVAKANVLIDAAQAGIGILKSSQSIPAPFNAIFAAAQLAALAASSAAAIREINSAEPGGGGGGAVTARPATATIPSFTAPGQGTTTGAPTVTPQPEPVKAYVLSGDVSSAQEADARINTRRKL